MDPLLLRAFKIWITTLSVIPTNQSEVVSELAVRQFTCFDRGLRLRGSGFTTEDKARGSLKFLFIAALLAKRRGEGFI